VRNPKEFSAAHVEGASHIPLGQLVQRIDEAPEGEVWVHCAAGYRASVAASVLAAHGRKVVAIDDSFDESAGKVGLPLVSPA
jgi:hydroxyacylglutathione hydrolase